MIEIESTFTQPHRYHAELYKKRFECDEVLSIVEVCSWLDVSELTLMRYVEEHNFPCKQIGKTRLFGKRAIIDWINQPE